MVLVRILDLFKVPTTLDINGGSDRDKPYRASCPKGDWTSDRWVSTARTAREQQTHHYAQSHYRYDQESWGAGPSGGGLFSSDTHGDDRSGDRGLFW